MLTIHVALFDTRGGSSALLGTGARAEWFDTSCIAEQAFVTFGSARTGDAYGPGFQQWPMGFFTQPVNG